MSEDTGVKFTGSGFQALGWGLFRLLMNLFVIPAAWGAVAIYRWFVRSLRFSDGTTASFEGRGEQVWFYFVLSLVAAFVPAALSVLVGFVPALSHLVEGNGKPVLVSTGLSILMLPIAALIWLKIYQWIFTSIRLSSGGNLTFKGTYGPLLGWMVLLELSYFTIIGWAFVAVAALRWACRNIEGGTGQFEFVGSGWGLLWRGLVGGAASMLIIPIPWVWVWIARWIMSNVVIRQTAIQ